MNGPYDDIINSPHHVSPTRPRMPLETRAAQFSPFAALTGYDEAVKETSRLTDERIELDENEMDLLDMKLHILTDRIKDRPKVSITYFVEDEKKDGGNYVTICDRVKKVDSFQRFIVFDNGKRIKIHDILDIECDMFGELL